MTIKFVFGILPALVIYTDKIPAAFGGMTNGPVVRIRPKYQDDKGLHAHELTHVEQWYASVFIWLALVALIAPIHLWRALMPMGLALGPILYTCIARVRLWCEEEAYQAQAKYTQDTSWMSHTLATKYQLGITEQEAYRRLFK